MGEIIETLNLHIFLMFIEKKPLRVLDAFSAFLLQPGGSASASSLLVFVHASTCCTSAICLLEIRGQFGRINKTAGNAIVHFLD